MYELGRLNNLKKQNIPKIRFNNYTDAWEQRKLGEVADFSKGNGYSKADLIDEGQPIILYGRLYTNYETVIRNVETFARKKANSVFSQGGEVIVPASGESAEDISRASVVEKSGVMLGGDLNIITVNEKINPTFLALTISNGTQQKELSKRAQGKSVVHLRNTDLEKVDLLFPSNSEQKKIGDFFSNIDNLIALHQRKLEELKSFKSTMLSKMFPKHGQTVPEIRLAGFDGEWERTKLGALGSVAMNKRIFKDETSEDGEIPFYKIGTFGGVADSFISRARFEEYKQKYPYPEIGDILISASGSIGRTVEYMGEEAYYQDSNIVWLKHDNRLVNSFLKQFYSIVKWNGIEGTTIKRLYNKNILETEIPLPSLEEQQAIGELFSNLDDLISSTQSKIGELKTLKKKLLQEMFVN